ncbi:MAG: succinate dehydrogenase, hydrophobic membrane anchor protein [Methylococcales symbiont of Iophon sp. n. MRB-2018]|nr:MAG: succinate dehydrogenase, hydrophobic membrane anchor protein [Methylococcales symbiont of Iophon sp. n. MRB-2018]KAF3980321.1 MAG: succinate dehydrogenase, hydrophobic membrane anchor protein [Methylococcales symbiont of Iophon sp. n. MRB-2018]
MDLQTPLAKVRGLGSAKAGTHHFWMQRITAISLIPLSFWMVSFTRQLLTASHSEMVVWLAAPVDTSIAIAWIIAAFYHAALGLQVVIEDYVHSEWLKITSIWLMKLTFFFFALATIVAIFRISLQG